MAEGVVRELITKLGFKLDDGPLKQAQSGVLSLKNALGGLAAAFALHEVWEAIKGAAEFGDHLIKTSQKIGLGVESLQRLEYAARLADVSAEQLSTGMGILSRNIVAAQKGSDQATESFQEIFGKGFDPKGIKDNEQLLISIADKFKTLEDGPQKTALAMKLFGKSGKELIPLLNAGGDAIREMGKELDDLGLIFGEDLAKKSEEFNDNLFRLHYISSTLVKVVVAKFIPALLAVTENFLHWVRANKDFLKLAMEKVFNGIAVSAELLYSAFRFVWNITEGVVKAFDKLVKELTRTKTGTIALTAAVTALALAFGFVEIVPLLLAALGAAIFLLIDDIEAYIEGRPSFLKPLYDKAQPILTELREDVNSSIEIMGNLWELASIKLADGFHWLGEQIRWAFGIEHVQKFFDMINSVANSGSGIFNKILGDRDAIDDSFKNWVSQKLNKEKREHGTGGNYGGASFDWMSDSSPTLEESKKLKTPESVSHVGELIKKTTGGTNASNVQPIIAPNLSRPSNMNQNNNFNVNQKIDVNVKTDADAQKIGEETGEQVKKVLNEALFMARRTIGAIAN